MRLCAASCGFVAAFCGDVRFCDGACVCVCVDAGSASELSFHYIGSRWVVGTELLFVGTYYESRSLASNCFWHYTCGTMQVSNKFSQVSAVDHCIELRVLRMMI